MWGRIPSEISFQILGALFLVVLAIFCPHSDAARLPVSASGDLRLGSNTVTFKGDLSVQGVSILDTFSSLDTSLVQADLYNLNRLNALRIQQLVGNYTSSAIFTEPSNSNIYMVAVSLSNTIYLYKWSNSSLTFGLAYSVGMSGVTNPKSVKVLQTTALETYALVASSSGQVLVYKFSPGSEIFVIAGFASNAPPTSYGSSGGSNDASVVQHSNGNIFYTQMTPFGVQNNIYRTLSNAAVPVWSSTDTNAAGASGFFTIGSTLYAVIGYSNINTTRILYTPDGLNFTSHHNVSSAAVTDIDTFPSGNTTYMVLTESVYKTKEIDNVTRSVPVSEVFRWNGTGFTYVSDFIVQNPSNSRVFTFQGVTFLVVSNYYSSTTDWAPQLFRWNAISEEFVLVSSLNNVFKTLWWEAFSSAGKNFLILNTASKTFVYKLNLN